MIATGTTLQQRYKIDKQIGQGGMGAVYVATDQRFGSTVAIKETLCMDNSFRKAIEREAHLLNSLKHSALPRVSDHFEEENSQFLVMEYIPGDDVCCILDRELKPFEVDQVLKWADDLLDALDYLHTQEMPVIHRDIKPQNLKITPRGQIILLDFGLAKGNPTDASNQTAAKSIFGYSRSYASLEQIQGTGTDPRSDLYALAATLYHLLTNQVPEDALTRAMAVLGGRPDPLVPASTINPAVPKGVAGVLQCALSLNAEGRPASAANMREMFHQNANFAYLIDDPALTVSNLNTIPANRVTSAGLIADLTRAAEAKTEVLPAFRSQPTAVKTGEGEDFKTAVASGPSTFSPQRKSRMGLMGAGALALLIGGAAIAGGVYVLTPSRSATVPEPEKLGSEPVSNISVAGNTTSSAPAVPEQSGQTATSGTSPGPDSHTAVPPSTGQGTNDRQLDTDAKKEETGKTGTVKQTATVITDPDLGDVKIEPSGNGREMTVTTRDENGKMITTRIPMPKEPPPTFRPPPNGYNPFPPGFDPRFMTPEQKRKLQQMIRRQTQRSINANRPPEQH